MAARGARAAGETSEGSQGLREAGYVDGQNILLKTRFHRGVLDRINEFAGELVARITAQPAALSP